MSKSEERAFFGALLLVAVVGFGLLAAALSMKSARSEAPTDCELAGHSDCSSEKGGWNPNQLNGVVE